MRRMKKLTALLLTCVMAVSAVGCGNVVDKTTSDTVLWINGTYAVLTKLNSCDYTEFGGMKANSMNKEIMQNTLNEWWGITDRDSADEMITWLLDEGGHRVGFGEDMRYLEDNGMKDVPEDQREQFIFDNFEMEEEQAKMYAALYTLYLEKGEDAILGWDYCRAMNLLGDYYIAGYYSNEEALDKSLDIGKEIQTEFDSWDSMMDSYLAGYEYWAEESSDERRSVYEEIKAAEDSPYNLDWNLELEKTW